ncbi:MAG TPA: hypothetical protein VGA40_04265, partial [Candidatus Acidoferrales bacterium]
MGCGADFSLSDDALTLGGDSTSTPSGGQAAPSSERVAPPKDVAAGVLTPPPSSVSLPGTPPTTHVSAVA